MKRIWKALGVCVCCVLFMLGCSQKTQPELDLHTETMENTVPETTGEMTSEKIQKETENPVSQKSSTEIIGTEQEISAESVEEASKAAKVYEYWDELRDEKDLPYADETTVQVLMDAYEELEYVGIFEPGNVEDYDEYIKKYKRLVDNEVPFLDDEGNAFYVKEYERLDQYPNATYSYYFFDMDGDEEPELGIQGYMGNYFLDVFDYDREADVFRLWYSAWGAGYELGGKQKIFWGDYMHTGPRCSFAQLDEDGNEELHVLFFLEPYYEGHLCCVMVPEYADESREIELTDEMKKRGFYITSYGGMWYFRIPEEEYEQLEKKYDAANMEADKRREEVTYTYEELFGADW